MRTDEFRGRMAAGDELIGTFVKTPRQEIVEILAVSGLDFICLDAEHAPFGRAELDVCLAVARALDLPTLVRVARARPEAVLQALDMGAAGIVAPHVGSAEVAADVARWSRFGPGGRGFAGSTRFGGLGVRPMRDVLAASDETVVIVQAESPEAVEAAPEIAGTEGVDALFLGPSDLSVALGVDPGSAEIDAARRAIGAATRGAGKTFATWVRSAAAAGPAREAGVTMLFVASEQAWMLAGAQATVADLRGKA
jgi:2-keto-3-deoxy-L-rhamnonate aldolase RhmA